MFRLLFAVVLSALPALPVLAACNGRDLISAMPAAERAEFDAVLAGVPYSEGLIWRATRGEQIVHLVGTYHFDDPRHASLVARIAPLVDRADTLLVEATAQEEADLMRALAERPEVLFITEGPTLPEMMSEADWQALMVAFRLRGIPPMLASKFRPWYVATLLSLPPCAMESIQNGGRGLDHRVMALARARDLPTAALEPFDTLFKLFDALSEVDEIGMIRTTMLMSDGADDMSVTLANAFFRETPWAIWELTRSEALKVPGMTTEALQPQIDLTENVLMTARNIAWIPVILNAAEQGEVLAAFGALHLPGAQGVLALLKDEGFTIQRLR